MITTDTYQAALDRAAAKGAEHGLARAGWVFDGNTPTDTYQKVLSLIETGAPELDCILPYPDLSGEQADGYTPAELWRDCQADDAHAAELDSELCLAYEQGFSDAVVHEVERVCRLHREDPA